ncbi:hypothetical protein [Pseudomonas fluorescens group sp. PF-69]
MDDSKKLSIKDLLKGAEKRRVLTSIGPLYVRHLTYGDHKKIGETGAFERADAHEVGRLVVQLFSSSNMDSGVWTGLSDDEFARLEREDIEELAKAGVEGAGYENSSDLLSALGKGVMAEHSNFQQMNKKISDQFRSNYEFLKPGAIESLTSSIAAIDNASQWWRQKFSDKKWSKVGDAVRAQAIHSPRLHQPKAEAIEVRTAPFLDFSTSPQARAANASEEAAETLSTVAVHMGDMLNHVASLSTTLVSDAIPQWIKQQDEDKAKAEASLKGAAKSLWWTKWAVIISVVTSIGIALAQAYFTKRDGAEESRLNEKMQVEWQKQAELSQELLRKQILETQYLRTELKALNAKFERSQGATVFAVERARNLEKKIGSKKMESRNSK